MGELFSTLITTPLYNALVLIVSAVPSHDIGIAVIVLTVLVKFALLPLAAKASRTQYAMKRIEQPLLDIQKRYKDDRMLQAQKTMELYKEHKVNPFSSILVLFIQLPVILGLYWVFYKGGFPAIDVARLYDFVAPAISEVNMQFLSFLDLSERSILLAILAGVSQFFLARAMPVPASLGEAGSLKAEFAKSMQVQIRYVLPVLIGVIAYTISAAVALYWIAGNIFGIVQEKVLARRYASRAETEE